MSDAHRERAFRLSELPGVTTFAPCMAKSPEGHSCALPLNHADEMHFGGSPIVPEVEWIWWPRGEADTT